MKIDREKIFNKFDGHCSYCGTFLESPKKMQVDHMHPVWRDQLKDMRTNDEKNLMPSCRRCNHYKRGDDLEQFRKKMKTLHERIVLPYIHKVALDFGIMRVEPFDGIFYFEKYTIEDKEK